MYAKLFLHDGSGLGKSKELNHYRLIYESDEKVPYDILNSPDPAYSYMLYYNIIFPIPADQFYVLKPSGGEVKIFEYVKGAKIKGKTVPNSAVTAIVKVVTNQKRKFDFITKTISSNNGEYTLVLPYSNEIKKSGTNLLDKYIITSNNIKKNITISEEDVISGKIVYLDLD